MDKRARIYVAGHRGMVGGAVWRTLLAQGYTDLVGRTSAELDLTRQEAVERFFEEARPDYVFLAAAKVGGIWANNAYPGQFIYSNLAIQTNVVHAAWKTKVKKLLFLGSSCIYPRDCPQPIREDYLLTGPLETTNEAYAVAKIAGLKLCEHYCREYGAQFWSVMPTNLYGENDHFDLATSHVLPAMLRKCHLAKLALSGDAGAIARDVAVFGPIPERDARALGLDGSGQTPRVLLWGSGRPRREFLHVEDLARACAHVMQLEGEAPRLLNIGCGEDVAIAELAGLVKGVAGFSGEIAWDADKPDGTPRKLLDVTRIRSLGWSPTIGLEEGIARTYKHYLERGQAGA